MERLYTYTGNISSFSVTKTPSGISDMDMIVDDLWDRDKAPTRLQAWGEMAEYLADLSDTDDEEKYLQKEIFYDELLTVKYIVIHADESKSDTFRPRPAKIIAMLPDDPAFSTKIIVFGPAEHINTGKPVEMSKEEWGRFLDWKRDNELYRLKI